MFLSHFFSFSINFCCSLCHSRLFARLPLSLENLENLDESRNSEKVSGKVQERPKSRGGGESRDVSCLRKTCTFPAINNNCYYSILTRLFSNFGDNNVLPAYFVGRRFVGFLYVDAEKLPARFIVPSGKWQACIRTACF